jgi:hypothetical protein
VQLHLIFELSLQQQEVDGPQEQFSPQLHFAPAIVLHWQDDVWAIDGVELKDIVSW